MRMKILGAVALAASLALAGCSGSSGSSSSSSGTTSAATTTSATTTTGSSTSSSTGSPTTSSSTGSPTTTSGSTGSPTTSGSTGSPTTTGSTGGGSTGTSATTGAPGTTNQNCGISGTACSGEGVDCYNWNAGSTPAIYACGCHPLDAPDGGTYSSNCAANTDGNTICDEATYTCRAPRDQEAPAQVGANAVCDTDYVAVQFGDGTSQCVQPCNTTADCDSNFVSCVQNVLQTVDGGAVGACLENDCGPGIQEYAQYADGGVESFPDGGGVIVSVDLGSYYQPCDTDGANNTPATVFADGGSNYAGYCQPLPANVLGDYIGLCYRNGPVAFGDECSGFFGPVTGACQAGAICLGTGVPNGAQYKNGTQTVTLSSTQCSPMCNAGNGQPVETCPAIQGATSSCVAFGGQETGAPLQVGYCQYQ